MSKIIPPPIKTLKPFSNTFFISISRPTITNFVFANFSCHSSWTCCYHSCISHNDHSVPITHHILYTTFIHYFFCIYFTSFKFNITYVIILNEIIT